jgi:nucleotide-binding universal stress UspA family protein
MEWAASDRKRSLRLRNTKGKDLTHCLSLLKEELTMAKYVCPTPGFEKLLLATDGSEFSAAAVKEAITIASTCSSTLYVVHVIETGVEVELWDTTAAEKLERYMRKYLEGIRAKAVKQGVKCELIMHLGDDPYKIIVLEAKKHKVSTIVMGTHGRTGLTRLMMGSTVSRVIGHAPCRVLVVPVKKRKK